MFIWFIAALFYFFEVILRVSPNAITQELMAHFQITSTALGFMTSAYYYAYVPLQIPCGLIVDRFGTRNILTLSALISSLGILLFGMGYSFPLNILARFTIGAGAACAFISCLKVINSFLPQKFFGYFTGITNLMGTLGAMMAGRPLALFISQVGWQSACYVLAMAGFLLVPILFLFVKNTQHEESSTNLSTKLFSDKNLWLIGIASGLMYVPITVFGELWGTPFLEQTYQLSKLQATTLVGLIFLGSTIGSIFITGIANKIKSYLKVMQVGSLLCGALFIGLLHSSINALWILILLIGIVASAQVLCFSWINDYCGKDSIGTGVGFCNTLTMCSGLIFQPLLGYILDLFWTGEYAQGARLYSDYAYFKAMLIIPVCFVIAFIILRQVKESHYLSDH